MGLRRGCTRIGFRGFISLLTNGVFFFRLFSVLHEAAGFASDDQWVADIPRYTWTELVLFAGSLGIPNQCLTINSTIYTLKMEQLRM